MGRRWKACREGRDTVQGAKTRQRVELLSGRLGTVQELPMQRRPTEMPSDP